MALKIFRELRPDGTMVKYVSSKKFGKKKCPCCEGMTYLVIDNDDGMLWRDCADPECGVKFMVPDDQKTFKKLLNDQPLIIDRHNADGLGPLFVGTEAQPEPKKILLVSPAVLRRRGNHEAKA